MKNISPELRQFIPTNWPIGSMVASNPWEGFIDLNMAETLRFLARWPGLKPKPGWRFFLEKIDVTRIIEWAKSRGKSQNDYVALWHFLHTSAAEEFEYDSLNYPLSGAQQHFETWFCNRMMNFIRDYENGANELLTQPENMNDNLESTELFSLIWPMRGWLGLAKWQEDNPEHPAKLSMPPLLLLEKKAVSLIEDYQNTYKTQWDEIKQALQNKPIFPNLSEMGLFLDDKELLTWDYFDILVFLQDVLEHQAFVALQKKLETFSPKSDPSLAQWVCCIDVRSEPLRRQLEQVGKFETFGYAGFFGMLIEADDTISRKWLCPAIAKPAKAIKIKSKNLPSFANASYPKNPNFAAALGWFDIQTLPSLLQLIKNSIQAWHSKESLLSFTPFRLPENFIGEDTNHTMLTEEAVVIASQLLKGIGLTKNFARLVMITAHKASSRNNPYHSTLECGACGGNSGEMNAALMADILNNQKVRNGLKNLGITIPTQTRFLGACHNTTTQSLEIFSDNIETPEFQEFKKRCGLSLIAYKENAKEDLNSRNKILRAQGFDELNPDWGLVNHYAMLIARRERSEQLDLNSEVFLHSYDYTTDKDGSILESILTAPVIVAHQINMQYLSASLYPEDYGSGSKTLHSLIPGVGNVLADGVDLALGLPRQSMFWQEKLLHEPRRLLVLIDAPTDTITNILVKHPVLHTLWKNGWVKFGSMYEKIALL